MPEVRTEPTITAQLFAAAGISRVVFVDDRHGITHQRLQDDANGLEMEALQKSGAFPAVDFNSDNEEVKRERIAKAIMGATPEALTEMFDKIASASGEYDPDRDKVASQYFESVVGESVKKVYLSLKEWNKHRDDHIAEAKDNSTLFIFDEDFSLEGQSKTHGRTLIEQTHATFPEYKFVYALLTHNVQNDDAEVALQKEIVATSSQIDGYILVISKSRLSEGGDRFAQRMKHLLLYRLFDTLTKRLREETAKASKKAIEEIESLGIESFERIILGTSRGEGAWPPETLVRVIGVYQQQQIQNSIRKDAGLHQSVREIDPICTLNMKNVRTEVAERAFRLQHDEIYESAGHVNSANLPIASGDIFSDDSGQKYVLLAQPCDLMVRANGLRKGERDSRQLVPLAAIRNPDSKYKNHLLPPDHYEMKFYDSATRWAVKLGEIAYLPIWLLDFATLNVDGRCSLVEDLADPPLLISPWRTRLPILKERATVIMTEVGKMAAIETDRNTLLQSYCRMPLDSPFDVELTSSVGDNPKRSLALKLKRVERISEAYATDLLIDYSAYLSRLAHPHDLTRLK